MKTFQQARHNMITHQLRPWGVLDEKVLYQMAHIPREQFVPKDYHNLAYADINIPLTNGHQLLQPKIIAKALQALKIKDNEVVLEIGTQLGYTTSLLARMAAHVYSVDLETTFTENAKNNLKMQGIINATLERGNAAEGWPKHAPYDVIYVAGSYPEELPFTLKCELKTGGRCFAIIGQGPVMKAKLFTNGDELTEETLFETMVPNLINAPKPSSFIF